MTPNNPKQNSMGQLIDMLRQDLTGYEFVDTSKPKSHEWWEEELVKTFLFGQIRLKDSAMSIVGTDYLVEFIRKLAKAEYERGYRACQDKGETDSWHRNSEERKADMNEARKLALEEAIEVLEKKAELNAKNGDFEYGVHQSIESLKNLLTPEL